MTTKQRFLEEIEKVPEDLPLAEFLDRLYERVLAREFMEQGKPAPSPEALGRRLQAMPWNRNRKT